MIKLIDSYGDTFSMTYNEVADCIRTMGNLPGAYRLLPVGLEPSLEGDVIQFRASDKLNQRALRYAWYSRIARLFRKDSLPIWAKIKGDSTQLIIVKYTP